MESKTVDMRDFKNRKTIKEINKVTHSIKETGVIVGEACYRLAYIVRMYDSQMKANERNKLKKEMGR